MFGFKQIGVLKHPGYNGKGGGSAPTQTDFFGAGKRAPYANLLSQLLLGSGIIGGATTTTSSGGSSGGQWRGGRNDKATTTTTTTPGMSVMDYIKSIPGYQFGINQGADQINRQSAATGAGPSGAQNLALQNYGNAYAQTQYQQLIQNLMGPSGAGQGGIVTPAQPGTSFGAQALGAYAGAGFPGASSIFGSAGGAVGATGTIAGEIGGANLIGTGSAAAGSGGFFSTLASFFGG